MATTMQRWAIDDYGPANLRLQTVPIPEPGAGEVQVKVAAAALNHRDMLMIADGMGSPLAFPFSPGSDMAGTVATVGAGAMRFRMGDRVISTFMPGWIDGHTPGDARTPCYRALGGELPGVMAEYLSFPEGWLVRAPDSLDDAEASTLPVAGLTAWFALVERGRLRAGQTVLVQGTGGVALFGIQIACMHGASAIVTSGSNEKLARAMALGATHGINRTDDWVEAIYCHTFDHGADHILELVGGANLARSIAAVAVEGRISVIGLLDGLEIRSPAVPLLLKSPVIQQRYDFDDLPSALEALLGGPFGKVVVELK